MPNENESANYIPERVNILNAKKPFSRLFYTGCPIENDCFVQGVPLFKTTPFLLNVLYFAWKFKLASEQQHKNYFNLKMVQPTKEHV